MTGFNGLITGATSGIGRATAFALAERGFRLLLVGRDQEKLTRTVRALQATVGDADVTPYVCDLSLCGEVHKVAKRIMAEADHLDVLVNNAGGRYLRHQMTREGYELTLATNHLGHFILTLSLMDLLRSASWPRIINVSSAAHYAGRGVIQNIRSVKDYNGLRQYADSKLANVLFTYALADRLRGRPLGVYAVDPGGVATNFGRNDGWICWLRHRVAYGIRGQLRSAAEGADTIVHLAASDDAIAMKAGYFRDRRAIRSSEVSYGLDKQEELWKTSTQWSKIDL